MKFKTYRKNTNTDFKKLVHGISKQQVLKKKPKTKVVIGDSYSYFPFHQLLQTVLPENPGA